MNNQIAVVGIGCRYPGNITSPESMWELLDSEVDAISSFPSNRHWNLDDIFDPDPDAPGKTYVTNGGFIHDAHLFDNEFFGINPREAMGMDPQHRVLLHVTWEALERAAVLPKDLKGTRTGVYVGIMANEYGHPLSDVQREAEGYMAIGTSPSVASGRIAYVLGLNGPAITFDTACSSSLVAIHSAIAALRSGEVDMALAGGSSIQATPGMFVDFSRQRGLAPDGRCKSFSDDADGTSWAEGAGVLVLERLEDAQKAGRNIVGVLRGSAINQDGASNGLSAPSGRAQRDVIRLALADANLVPDDVDMIEAHGTGTKLGDPIEANALIEVYAKERKNAPIGLGSLKSNIGHAMAAAGVGGLIKCLISMAHGRMPKSLHIGTPSLHVEWPDTVRLLTNSGQWPARDGVRRAAVSSFGISGTNAHVLVESYNVEIHQGPDNTTTTSVMDSLLVLPFGAKSPSALKSLSSALSEFVVGEDNVSGFCRAYALGRESMPFRAVARGRSQTELTRSLDETTAFRGVVDRCRTIDRPVLVFPGQGGQWDGMGRDLYRSNSIFRRTVNVCSDAFEAEGHLSVRSYFEECSDSQNIEDIGELQPVLFTLMAGLAEVWKSVGVRASAVVGHSQGEVAAAFVAGALDLNDAVRIVLARSRLLRRIAGHGGMVVVGAGRDVTQAAVTHLGLPVSIASSNGPRTTTVAGVNEQDLQILLDYCDDNNIFARRLAVDCASHSSAVDGLKIDLLAELADIRPRDTTTRMYSTVTCGPVRGSELDGDYWFQNLRHEVCFHATVVNLIEEGYDAFVEASPHPTTVQALQDTADNLGRNTVVLQSLRRDVDSLLAMVDSVSEAYVAGFDIAWDSFGATQRSAALCNAPTYPFVGSPFWSRPREIPRRTVDRKALRANVSQQFHPWLSNVFHSPRGNTIFTGSISVRVSPWLADHRVDGCIYVPGAAIVEILCTVGRSIDLEAVNEVSIVNPLELLEDGSNSDVYIDVSPIDADGSREFVLHAKLSDADQWTLISQGSLSALGAALSSINPRAIRSDGEGTVNYEQLHANGYQYGPAFRGALTYRTVGDSVTSELSLPPLANVNSRGLAFHPVILDAALHTAISAGLINVADDEVLLPFSWTDIQSYDFNHSSAIFTATVEHMSGNAVTVEIRNEHRDIVISVGRLEFRPVSATASTSLTEPHLYGVDWRKFRTERVTDTVSPRALIVISDDDRVNVIGGQLDTVVSSVKEAVDFIRSSVDTYRYVVLPIADDLGHEDAFDTDYASSAAALAHAQEWLALSADLDDVQLVVVTSNSMGPRSTAGVEVVSGGVWGIFRAAQAEWPDQIRLLDVDVDISALTSFDWWTTALECNARQIAVRQGRLYAPVLKVIPTDGTDSAMSFDGTLLVTGGAGTLGALVVRHMVRSWGVRSVVLMGRSGLSSSFAQDLVAELEAEDVLVAVTKGDVALERDVRAAIDAAPAGWPIRGVIHAAGILDDAPVATMTEEQLDNVMRVKVQGARNLAAATQNHDLQLFVTFSSVHGHLGGPGQANYSAANVCIDSLADNLRSSGRHAVSIGWGLWGTATGMTSHLNSVDKRRLADSGVLEFDVEAGLRLLDRAVQGPNSVVIAARLNTLVTSIVQADTNRAAVTPHIAGEKQKGESARLAPVELPESDIEKLPPPEQSRVVIEYIRSAVSTLLDRPISDIDFRMPFHQMGFDSLTTMELRNRLNKALGVRLSATTIFNNPTLDELARHIIELVEEEQAPNNSRERTQLENSSGASIEKKYSQSVIIEPSPLQEAYILGRGSEFELGEVSTYFYISVDILGLDLHRFDAVLNSMVAKHDSLRTVVSRDGKLEILQSVPKFASTWTDLRGLGKVDQLKEAEFVASEIRNQVLDVRSWPLFDVRALELDENVTRLLLGFDVLIVDGSSAAVLFSEISQMYNSSAGTVSAHPQFTYARYRALAAKFWPSSEIDRAHSYWMERIDALPLGPELPVLKTGSNSARGRFSHRSKTFSKDKYRAFKEHCMSAGFTPSVALCSAYALVIGRWSAEQKFALNVMSSSRLPVAEGVDSVVGNFSQTAILEVDVSDDVNFSLVCARVQKQMWRDMEFAQFSGVEVIREINRRRGTIGRATFPVVFTSTLDSTAMRDSSRSGMIAPLLTLGSDAKYVDSGLRTPQVWIDHQAVEEHGDLILNWDCVEDLFPNGVLDQMFSEYWRVVEMLMDDRDVWREFKLSDLKLDDRKLSKFIESRATHSDSRLLHSGFLDQCSKRPDALAIICQETVLTYSELDSCANNIATELQHHRKTSRPLVVGVVMNKGWEQIAAVVAVLKCGATYVPIAPDAPPKRVDEILASSNVMVLLTQQEFSGTSWLTETKIRSVVIDSSFIVPSANEVISDACEHDLAYIIYTSGSTGTPKGVEIEHAAVVNTIEDVNRRLELSESDRVFALSALQFDLSVWDIFGPLSVGGSVVVPGPDELIDPQAWMRACVSGNVTVWNSVPALMDLFAESLASVNSLNSCSVSIRSVLLSGDWIPLTLPAAIRRSIPGVRIWSLGGATEVSIWSIIHEVHDTDDSWRSIPYGTALANQNVHVLDSSLRPCPDWVRGEIYFSGMGLARGYAGDNEKTARAFAIHQSTGLRLYKTGDYGLVRPGGVVEFLGRKDAQVKINGYRIELGEIESALLRCNGVSAAAVVVRQNGVNKQLVAVVAMGSLVSDTDWILRELSSYVPNYMLPSRIHVVDQLPLTVNGKVDRDALQVLASIDTSIVVVEAGSTDTELRIMDVWRELLPDAEIDRNSKFFSAGGDSLAAIRLVGRMREIARWDVPAEAVLSNPTVAELAIILDSVFRSTVV